MVRVSSRMQLHTTLFGGWNGFTTRWDVWVPRRMEKKTSLVDASMQFTPTSHEMEKMGNTTSTTQTHSSSYPKGWLTMPTRGQPKRSCRPTTCRKRCVHGCAESMQTRMEINAMCTMALVVRAVM